jgi:hypothetical protein
VNESVYFKIYRVYYFISRCTVTVVITTAEDTSLFLADYLAAVSIASALIVDVNAVVDAAENDDNFVDYYVEVLKIVVLLFVSLNFA